MTGNRYPGRRPGLAAMLLATCVSPAWAQETGAEEGESIVVTGGALSVPGDAGDAIVIDRTALGHIASGRVEDMLRDVAGLQQFRRSDARSAHPTSQGMTMRGLGGNAASRTVVTLDDVPITDPFGGWVNWPSIDAARLGAIEVRRGGGTLSHGPGAVAGTIALFSANNPADHDPLTGSITYGSRNSVAARALVSGQISESGSALAAFQFERSDGFTPIAKGQRGSVDQPAPYQQGSLALRGVVDVGDSSEAQFALSAFRDRRNRGSDFTDSQSMGSNMSVRLVNRGALPWSAMLYGQLREMRSGFASVSADRNMVTQSLDQYRVPASGWGGALALQPLKGVQIGADWRFLSGESRERYTFVAGNPTRLRKAGGNARTLGVYVDASVDIGANVTLDAAARLDHWRLNNGVLDERSMAGGIINETQHPERKGTEPSISGGLTFRPTDGLALNAAAYRNWRLPTLNELYRPYRVGADAIAANPALSPEHVEGGELGARYTAGKAHIGLTFFSNRLESAIANVTLARGPGMFPGVGFVSAVGSYKQRQNLNAIQSKGIELDARLPLDAQWSVGGSYAYTDAKVEASGAALALDGLRPAQVARHSSAARVDWSGDKADGFLVARYIGPQFEDDQNAIRLKSALTFDAGFSIGLTGGLRLDFKGENLANKRVEAARSSSGIIERATPRTLWIGLRYLP